MRLSCICVQRNYGGIENLSLIPGTVGAAPIQNIGAYGVDIRHVIETIQTIELSSGNAVSFNQAECHFEYRHSIFKSSHKNRFFITHITVKLSKNPQLITHYGAIQSTLKKKGLTPSVQTISQAVIHIRQQKLPDPEKLPNAGSFFKNPLISLDTLQSLQNKNPGIPYYPEEKNHVKVPAAWLVEQCGWKGRQAGKAGVHFQQPLVLVNHKGASGEDIKQLAQSIQQSIATQFGITLSPEVTIL